MTADIYFEERPVIEAAHYLPAISIIQPFEPMMSSKSELEFKLKQAVEKVESRLMTNYPVDKALPLLLKLNFLIHNLNYNTHKNSIAIFLSPVTEKVYYLDIHVEERIVVDESFKIRDLIYCKKQNVEYLVLMLSEEKSKMYLANGPKFTLIKSNVLDNIFVYNTDTVENEAGSSNHEGKEILLDKFLHQMDEGLTLILNAYKLLVFVVGTEKVVEHFKKITKNAEKLATFIHGNYTDAAETEMHEILQPYIEGWKMIKQENILLEIGKAVDYEKVAFGIHDVLKAATQKKSRLLVVEKDFIYPAHLGADRDTIFKAGSILNSPFYIKDVVDDVIEKVLQNGGDVEFIDNDMLKGYGRIALIQSY